MNASRQETVWVPTNGYKWPKVWIGFFQCFFFKPRQEANRHAEGLKECRKMCETQKRSLELLGLKWLVLGLWMWLMWHVKTS